MRLCSAQRMPEDIQVLMTLRCDILHWFGRLCGEEMDEVEGRSPLEDSYNTGPGVIRAQDVEREKTVCGIL